MDALDAAQKAEELSSLAFDIAVKGLDCFQKENLTTVKEFKAHGTESAEPMIKEFKRLFLDPKGDYYDSVAAFMAARVFNPLCAVGMNKAAMIDAIKSLFLFGFDEFRHGRGIIEDLVKELPKYRAVVEATTECYWSEMEGAAAYDAKLRKQAEKNPEKYGMKTWKDDRVEKARRVWEWWRSKASKFNFFFTAARLIALVPVSSTSVERVFSQVKFIIETVCEGALEETLETRVMERVNRFPN